MRAVGVCPQGRTHAQSGAHGTRGARGGDALAVHARALAAAVAVLSLDDLAEFVDELPLSQFYFLREVVKDRTWMRRMARVPVPPSAPSPAERGLLDTRAAAAYLDCSPDEIRDRVRRGTLAAIRDRPGGHLHFEEAALEAYKAAHRTIATGVHRRYDGQHDPRHAPRPAPSPRLDAAPTRQRAQRDDDRREPVGTGRARHHAARRDRPYAPGKGAWAPPPPPPKPRVDE